MVYLGNREIILLFLRLHCYLIGRMVKSFSLSGAVLFIPVLKYFLIVTHSPLRIVPVWMTNYTNSLYLKAM